MTTAIDSDVEIFLHPGEWNFGDQYTRIHTTLGSCIAVTLWHPQLKIGGMCHYMLPGSQSKQESLNGRYAEDAMQLMIAETKRLNSAVGDYEVKLFGGANMFDFGPGGSDIAQRNIDSAESLMQKYKLLPMARSLGGSGYRRLIFDVGTGDIWVRHGESRIAGHLQCGSGDIA